jgi:hypothetical protein
MGAEGVQATFLASSFFQFSSPLGLDLLHRTEALFLFIGFGGFMSAGRLKAVFGFSTM